MADDLESTPEIIGEAVQTVLRRGATRTPTNR